MRSLTRQRPTHRNRIEDICVFQVQGSAPIGAIVDIQLAQLTKSLFDRKLELVLDAATLNGLGGLEFDKTVT